MSVRLLDISELTAHDIARWDSLSERAAEPNPFLDPAFLIPIAAAWPEAAGLQLAVLADGEQWNALFAFTIEHMAAARARIPVMSLAGQFLSGATGRQHPLVAEDDPEGHVRALLRGLSELPVPRIIELGFVPGDGPLRDALLSASRARGVRLAEWTRDEVAYAAPGSAVPAAAERGDSLIRGEHLSASRRKVLRKCVHGIEHQGGGSLAHVDRSREPDAVRDFIELQAAGWKGDANRGGAAVALRPGYADAFAAMAERLRADGRWRLDALEVGGETVHIYTAIRAKAGGWFGLLDAYNEAFAHRKAGQLGRLAALQAVRGDFPKDSYDPCLGAHYAYDFALYPDRRPMAYTLVAYGGMRPSLTLAAVPALRGVAKAASAGKRRLAR